MTVAHSLILIHEAGLRRLVLAKRTTQKSDHVIESA